MDYLPLTEAIADKKGFDIKVLDISKISSFADIFIIASGNNVNQIQAICNNILDVAHKNHYEVKMLEGYDKANWILIDFGDIIVHIFDRENRNYYHLDHLWNDATVLME